MLWNATKALIFASLYKVAMGGLALAGLFMVPFAIWFGVTRPSRLTGKTIFTAPDWLEIFGNEQEGYDSPFALSLYKGWPTFWRRYAWAAWRNKIRNIPFVPALGWLHTPKGPLGTTEYHLVFRIRKRGWMTEFEYVGPERFGDFGPRLNQPFKQVSWAWRPWGRYPKPEQIEST